MLSGSRGDSTSVTKYPYVSPLPEAPSKLECYWYVDVSSRTETIGAPFEGIMSAANASHPFSIPFSVFLPDCLCLCMFGWLPKAEDTRLFVSYTRRRQWPSTRVTLDYPPPSCLSLLFSFPLLISPPARDYARASPMPRASCTPGRKGISWFRFSKLCLFAAVRSHRRTRPSSFFSLLEPLSPFFACLRITGLISILLSSFARSGSRLGISGENELFPYIPKWINRQKAENLQAISVIKTVLYVCVIRSLYSIPCNNSKWLLLLFQQVDILKQTMLCIRSFIKFCDFL